jgi:hypothetical protein
MQRRLFPIFLALALLAACTPVAPSAPPLPSDTPTPPASPTSAPAVLSSPTIVPTPVPDVLYVDPEVDLGPISPYIYGSNYGPWTAVPADMLQVAYDSHITALRWPGGNWGDQNDVAGYQIDMFMAFCKSMNAIPTISVRLLNGTPEAAAELVRYANIEQKYGITYWSIGNEPNLFDSLPNVDYDSVRFNQEWRAIAQAMKAVDPSIKLLGPELSQWGTNLENTPKDSAGRDWMTEFLQANGDLVDVVTVHRYPLYHADGKPSTVDDLRNNTLEWTNMVTYLRGLIHETTGRDIPLAFTEVNSDPSNVISGVASPDSFYNALWYADILGQLIQQGVFMVNNFVLANRTGGLGIIYGSEIRPIYYDFQIYSHFGTELVYASSGVEFVNVYAAKRADGALTIMVINLTDSEQQIQLQVQGKRLSTAEVWLLDATHNAEDMGQQSFQPNSMLTLPAQSASLYTIGN